MRSVIHNNKSLSSYGRKQILIVMVVLLMVILSTTSYFILRPFLNVASETIATQMVDAINNFKSEETAKINAPTSLSLTDKGHYKVSDKSSSSSVSFLPFIHFIKSRLGEKLDAKAELVTIDGESNYYWFKLKNQIYSVGFSKSLVGTRPELTILFIFSLMIILSYLFSFLISKRLNQPMIVLEEMINRLAKGDFSEKLSKHEILEIDRLFSQINKLSVDLKNLIEQRIIFLSGISHDIRTPITRLKLLLAVHEESLSKDYIEKSNRSINEIETLVKIYLDAGQLLAEEKPQVIEFSDLIDEVLANFDETTVEKIQIDINSNKNVNANRQAIKRVLINIISNAIKYAKPNLKGDIKIAFSTHKNGKLEITVTDSGEGIPEKHLEEIYKPFYRVVSEENDEIESSGLGLSICRQICLSQDWKLEINNKPLPETGLSISLYLPIGYS